ncbi:urokinase plasminogen activator surface receptor [Fundulus heteroclitus]|uniref:urokinase plasminogen activator surface receptor n=1 Tax=Fundulus heteroclitus TaxID=8078 RepID=UPI00165A2689|nr:urokinase plasminogen activator surface receptor [Fundulus heteroclitus]
MHFVTLIVGIWLLPKANTLKCYECTPEITGTCTDQAKECTSTDNRCAAMTVLTYTGDSKPREIKAKSCTKAEGCVNGSVNFGFSKTVVECCASDLCNTKHVSDPKSIPNGKKCYSCEGQKCTKTLNCEGDQDYCIKTRVNFGGETLTLKGCASKMVCDENALASLQTVIGPGSSCCQGDYCNSASSASAGLPLLLMSLSCLVLLI